MNRVWSSFKSGLLPLASALLLWDQSLRRPLATPAPNRSQVIRGEYENKIRRFSPHEKVFEVFATHYEKGQLYMDCFDLMKAICFYNYCSKVSKQTTQTEIPAEASPANIIEFVGGEDDRISIYDYFNLVAFMDGNLAVDLVDESWLTKTGSDNKTLTEEDIYNRKLLFNPVLKKAHENSNTSLKSKILLESRRVKINNECYEESVKACAKMLARKEKVKNLKDILRLRRRFLKELYKYEFYAIPRSEDNTIDSQDFAKSIVKYVDQNKLAKYIARAQNIDMNVRITCEQYVGFHLYLQSRMEPLKRLCEKKGALTAQEIHAAFVQNIHEQKEKYKLQEAQSHILLRLLDEDSSGFIQKRELETLISNLRYYSTSLATPQSPLQKVQKDWEMWKSKLRRIRDIIAE